MCVSLLEHSEVDSVIGSRETDHMINSIQCQLLQLMSAKEIWTDKEETHSHSHTTNTHTLTHRNNVLWMPKAYSTYTEVVIPLLQGRCTYVDIIHR